MIVMVAHVTEGREKERRDQKEDKTAKEWHKKKRRCALSKTMMQQENATQSSKLRSITIEERRQ